MDDLAERIKAAIENPNGELWFPDLTADLTARAWDSLHRDIGLTPDTYGTERVLSRSISAPHEAITSLKICPSISATVPAISIEVLTQKCAVQYQEQGIAFYSPHEILHTTVLDCIEEALAIINQVPSLMKTVATLVRSLHVIKPEDGDHDVSFSEPHIPFSVFVSVPEKRVANDGLRIAEAIVHEAMHLQLTLIDETFPLTDSTGGTYYSPWRGEQRSVLGVFHALYVFQVVAYVLRQLRSIRDWTQDTTEYINSRCALIRRQVEEIESFEHCGKLTLGGASLSRRLILIKSLIYT